MTNNYKSPYSHSLAEEYKNTYGSYGCEKSQPPPSSENAICKKYHEKIGQLKENPNREDIDENFVKEFLTRPTESLLIPTDEIRFGKLFDQAHF